MTNIDAGAALVEEELVPGARATKLAHVTALVVEDDPEVARICSHRLTQLGLDPSVVWAGEPALAALRAEDAALEFVYVDLSLRDGSGAQVAAEARRLHPGATIVTSSRSIADVLLSDGVVLCNPFTAEQFEAAFDAALFEGPDGWEAWHEAPAEESQVTA